MRSFRFVHCGVVAALAAALVAGSGLVPAADAVGAAMPSSFVPIVPCRLADTRTGSDHVGSLATAVAAQQSVELAVWGTNGNCTVPTSATAITTNVTAVNATAASYLTVYPADADPRPTASNLNYLPGSPPTPNQVTVGLSVDGAIRVFNNAGTVDIIVDIVGYYQAAGTAIGNQGPVGPQGPIGPAGPMGLQGLTGPAGLPGGTIALDGYNAVLGSGPGALGFNASGCATFSGANSVIFVPLRLPVGAKITAVQVQFVDPNSNPGFDYFLVASPTNGGGETLIANAVATTGAAASVPMTFTVPNPPPVSASNMYHIKGFGEAAPKLLCGIEVTYTM